MSNTNVAVTKQGGENGAALLRRFQKRVQESGVIPRVRSIRYNNRDLSDLKVKLGKLKKLKGAVKYNKMKRLGLVVDKKKGMKR